MKKISSDALVKLQNALSHIYWYKNELRTFILSTIRDPRILATQDWYGSATKRDLVQVLIRRFAQNERLYQEDLLALIRAVSEFTDFSHLERLEDGHEKAKRARNAVADLRKISNAYVTKFAELEKNEALREKHAEIIQQQKIRQNNLDLMKSSFNNIVCESDAQKKGFLFEKFLYDLFGYFDLDPKRSFRNDGEQIDGAFSFEGNDYLLEAKWVNIRDINKGTLLEFGAKVSEKLDNTLGVFVSYNGFSQECCQLGTTDALKPIFLVNGAEIFMILDGRITLPEMLLRKRRFAAQHGKIFLDLTKDA